MSDSPRKVIITEDIQNPTQEARDPNSESKHSLSNLEALGFDSAHEAQLNVQGLGKVEEIANYQFLNVVTEDITLLNHKYHAEDIKAALKASLNYETPNNGVLTFDDNLVLSDDDLQTVVSNFSDDTVALLRNNETFSYLELIDQHNHNCSCQIHMLNDSLYKINHNEVDQILINYVENHTHKN